jgi:predicted amidohydrolase YtcJ
VAVKPASLPLFAAFFAAALAGCRSTPEYDHVLANARVAQFDGDAISFVNLHLALRDGRIAELIPATEALPLASDSTDLTGTFVYPGLVDAHAHFMALGQALETVDLVGTRSWAECVERVRQYLADHPEVAVVRGRGWDQNDWTLGEWPTSAELDALSDKAIVLSRIDGHAVVCNQIALKQSGINAATRIEGGEIITAAGKPTGVLVDNAETLLRIAEPSREEKIRYLQAAERWCIDLGLTGVQDAGLATGDIMLIDSLQQAGGLRMPLYIMVSESPEALDHWLKRGPLQTDWLSVRSFKFYSDGALGSRGALLRAPYSDRHDHFGLALRDQSYLRTAAARIANAGWQMNTHAIGDSANHLVLSIYREALGAKTAKTDLRWRVEHAQVVSPEDRKEFGGSLGMVPSVQPTHATSDMDWAPDRLGADRMPHAYAYRSLREANGGWIPLGTDFPIEHPNPMYTILAATARRALDGHPAGGFQTDEALTLDQTILGMTRDAARASFREGQAGEIRVGNWADFTIFDTNLSEIEPMNLPKTQALQVWIHGERRK